MIKILLGTVAAFALATSAQASVNVYVWTGLPDGGAPSNATLAQSGLPGAIGTGPLGSPNITTTVGGINFATSQSASTTVGQWLGNPAISSTILNDSYFLFTGTIDLAAGDNIFTITHDDGLQLNIDGIGLVVDHPGPTSPVANTFTAHAVTAGTYNFELSYGECCAGPAQLTWLFNGSPVGSVPEPATWAMMLLGFAGIGLAVRRSRKPIAQLA